MDSLTSLGWRHSTVQSKLAEKGMEVTKEQATSILTFFTNLAQSTDPRSSREAAFNKSPEPLLTDVNHY